MGRPQLGAGHWLSHSGAWLPLGPPPQARVIILPAAATGLLRSAGGAGHRVAAALASIASTRRRATSLFAAAIPAGSPARLTAATCAAWNSAAARRDSRR